MTTELRDTAARAVIAALAATQDQRARLHQVALTVIEALKAGAEVRDLVERIVALTAPPAELPQPWARFLPMTLEQFSESGAALVLHSPSDQVTIYLVSDEASAERVEPWITTRRQVRDVAWARRELTVAGVPAAEWTVGKLAAILGAQIREVR